MGLKQAFKAFFNALSSREEKQEPPSLTKKDYSHLQLLTLLQKSGRLVDFLKEDISGYSDAQIGGAVRQIHADCAKLLEEWVTLRPVMEKQEGETIDLPIGYDSQAIKVVGNVKGSPPYKGKVVHQGWKAHKLSLSEQLEKNSDGIISPAEVEVN